MCCLCFGWNICLPVVVLHLPFCCCVCGGSGECATTACASYTVALDQTFMCGWTGSYATLGCCCEGWGIETDLGEKSYYDWLQLGFTEEEWRARRDAYVAKKTARRKARLERSLAKAQAPPRPKKPPPVRRCTLGPAEDFGAAISTVELHPDVRCSATPACAGPGGAVASCRPPALRVSTVLSSSEA